MNDKQREPTKEGAMIRNSGWFGITENYEQATERVDQALEAIKKLRESYGFKAGGDKDDMPAGIVVERDRLNILAPPATQEDVIQVAEEHDALAALIVQDVRIKDPKAFQEYYGKDKIPEEPWNHALFITVKTSRHLPGFMVVFPYAEGPNDAVVWQESLPCGQA